MEEGLIKVTPNKEKARSILKMVDSTIEMVKGIDVAKFSSNVTKEYYDVIRELMSVVLLLDGYKTYGEGAHKKLVEYIQSNYKEFNEYEISLIDDLRITRNRIAYDGFFVDKDYIRRKIKDIQEVIEKLEGISEKKIESNNTVRCEECDKNYEFSDLKFKNGKYSKDCREFFCPNEHLLGTMHVQCRTPLRSIGESGKNKYICDKCKKLFLIKTGK